MNELMNIIRQKYNERGRPLKIICDWDESLFSFRPTLIYKFGNINKPFKEFFEEFWENAIVTTDAGGNKKFTYDGIKGAKSAYEKFKKLSEERSKDSNKNADKYKWLNVVEDMSFLSVSEALLQALKENLISELVIVSTTRNEKSMVVESREKRFAETFGQFPQCKLSMIFVQKIGGVNKPNRWEVIKEKFSDFDIYIDDDYGLIESIRSKFPDRVYLMPNYKCNLDAQDENIYYVRQEVSDIRSEDFVKGVEEYKQKKPENLNQNRTTQQTDFPEKSLWKQPVLYWGLGGGLAIASLGLGIYFLIKKRNKQ